MIVWLLDLQLPTCMQSVPIITDVVSLNPTQIFRPQEVTVVILVSALTTFLYVKKQDLDVFPSALYHCHFCFWKLIMQQY